MVLQLSKEQLQTPCQARILKKPKVFSEIQSLNFDNSCNMQ